MIYSNLSVEAVVRWTLVVGAVVMVSAIYPALRVTRLAPVEAMRHV
jgi:ABC-type lipoprotein release transport system permease subunit